MKPASLIYAIAIASLAATCGIATAATPTPPAAQLGRQIDGFTLQDYRGKSWSLEELQGKVGTAIVFVGVECPIVAQYASRLTDLADKYAAAGVSLVAIDANQQDSLTELAHFARTHKLEIPVLKDPGNK